MFSHGCEGDAAQQRCFCPCTVQGGGGKAAPLALHESKGIFSFAKENIPPLEPQEKGFDIASKQLEELHALRNVSAVYMASP